MRYRSFLFPLKIRTILLSLSLSLSLTACSQNKEDKDVQTEQQIDVTASYSYDQAEQKSAIIQEDDKHLYLCGSSRLVKIDKTTGENEILWENTEATESEKIFKNGSGLLVGDTLFFLENEEGLESSKQALSEIQTDGSNYQKICTLDNLQTDRMWLQDKTLYIGERSNTMSFHIAEDGSLSEPETLTYAETTEDGSTILFQDKSGNLYVKKEHEIVRLEPDQKEDATTAILGREILGYNDKYILLSDRDENWYLKLYNLETNESKKLVDISSDGLKQFLSMDENYVYWCENSEPVEGAVDYVYKKFDLETGEESELFQQTFAETQDASNELMDIVVQDEHLYYTDWQNLNLNLMCLNLADSSSDELQAETLYDTGIQASEDIAAFAQAQAQEDVLDVPIVEKLTPEGQGWGLSFGEEGTQPVGNASREELALYDAYYCGDGTRKVLYLTFDCGYENGNTVPILEALKKHNAPATFFVVGHFLETEPELVKRMVEEGHAMGNHTYHHYNVSTLDKETFQKELEDVENLFREITGTELSPYYRPPEGRCGTDNLKISKELGYAACFWSLAHVDWDTNNQPSHDEAIKKLTSRVHPGAIVLLHNTSRTNGEILDELLTKWEEMGYTFMPLSDLTKK